MSAWREKGRCWNSDSTVFVFTRADCNNERDYNERVEKAQAICSDCPVRTPCAEEGRDMEYGIWGGIVS